MSQELSMVPAQPAAHFTSDQTVVNQMALTPTKERKAVIIDDELAFPSIPLHDLLSTLQKHWRVICLATGIAMVLAAGISLLLPNEYTSTAQLMPPDPRMFASSSLSSLDALTGSTSPSVGLGGSLLNQFPPGQIIMGILVSDDMLDDIINRFDLRKVYHIKLYVNTRKMLLKNTGIDEDKKSGIISIAVTDRDKRRAQQMVAAYIQDLNSRINSLSTSSARRERIFLEGRLKSIKENLDASSLALSQFSSRNNTIDIEKQGQATVETAAKLQGQLISAESDLSGLEAVFTNENVRVQEARRRVEELQRQLRMIAGRNTGADGNQANTDEPLPSIRMLPLLGARYYDLYNQVAMQETIYETLTKQYEIARIREAEEIPAVKVLDEPDLPEKKSKPHRILTVLLCGLLSFAGFWAAAFLRDRRSVRESLI